MFVTSGRHTASTMRFERPHEPLLPRRAFALRLLKSAALSSAGIFVSLALGVFGYRYFAGLPWIDAILNASMILTGMGPVNVMTTTGAKLFASCYALFSGIAFLTSAGVLVAPVAHRLLHRFHLDLEHGD